MPCHLQSTIFIGLLANPIIIMGPSCKKQATNQHKKASIQIQAVAVSSLMCSTKFRVSCQELIQMENVNFNVEFLYVQYLDSYIMS